MIIVSSPPIGWPIHSSTHLDKLIADDQGYRLMFFKVKTCLIRPNEKWWESIYSTLSFSKQSFRESSCQVVFLSVPPLTKGLLSGGWFTILPLQWRWCLASSMTLLMCLHLGSTIQGQSLLLASPSTLCQWIHVPYHHSFALKVKSLIISWLTSWSYISLSSRL